MHKLNRILITTTLISTSMSNLWAVGGRSNINTLYDNPTDEERERHPNRRNTPVTSNNNNNDKQEVTRIEQHINKSGRSINLGIGASSTSFSGLLEGMLLGGQLNVGYKGPDEEINTITTTTTVHSSENNLSDNYSVYPPSPPSFTSRPSFKMSNKNSANEKGYTTGGSYSGVSRLLYEDKKNKKPVKKTSFPSNPQDLKPYGKKELVKNEKVIKKSSFSESEDLEFQHAMDLSRKEQAAKNRLLQEIEDENWQTQFAIGQSLQEQEETNFLKAFENNQLEYALKASEEDY